jgi:hypothetical protein
VLFLGKLKRDTPHASWQELHGELSHKHPDLSKTKLHQIINSSKNLFSVVEGQVHLSQLKGNFLRTYFELAEGVEIIQRMTNSPCLNSSAEPFRIGFGNSILVTGLKCALEVPSNGKAVLFKFGGHATYRLENPLPVNNIEDHKLAKATLRIR